MAENIKTSVEGLRKLNSIENVVGKPIDAGDQFLIPVMRMGVGFEPVKTYWAMTETIL